MLYASGGFWLLASGIAHVIRHHQAWYCVLLVIGYLIHVLDIYIYIYIIFLCESYRYGIYILYFIFYRTHAPRASSHFTHCTQQTKIVGAYYFAITSQTPAKVPYPWLDYHQ
jgi:hypothetical protein